MHVLVMAKAPVPGRVKTRLCPPCTPEEAAVIAEAALADTLEAVSRCGADRRIVALDGELGPWLPGGFEVVTQRGRGLAERLGAAWRDAGSAGFQIGMDTPQLTATDLDDALARLDRPGRAPAVLGPAQDGGWWGVGMARPHPDAFAGVPMSTSGTGAAQRARLEALGMDVDLLAESRDIDTIDDLLVVSQLMGRGRTPELVTSLPHLRARASTGDRG
ncbi:MAG: TIGR04282 family arsenosugar biosynthesis glycosyltransferase [Actinomycetota bacterium]|nr:TIGR04282 family arsenosugar biosynthesis glycosyltransferase [Actinomycetota bacterium]